MCRVLLIDSDPIRLGIIEANLSAENHKIICVQTTAEAIKALAGEELDAVVLEDSFANHKMLTAIRKLAGRVGIVLLSDSPVPEADGFDVWSIIPKQVTIKTLIEKIQEAHEYKKMSDTRIIKIEAQIDEAQTRAREVQKKAHGLLAQNEGGSHHHEPHA